MSPESAKGGNKLNKDHAMTIIFVTHDKHLVDEFAQVVWHFEDGTLRQQQSINA